MGADPGTRVGWRGSTEEIRQRRTEGGTLNAFSFLVTVEYAMSFIEQNALTSGVVNSDPYRSRSPLITCSWVIFNSNVIIKKGFQLCTNYN